MKIAILTRPDFRSPRVLAESLKLHLDQQGFDVEIFDEINFLNRLVSWKKSNLSFHFWIKRKLQNYSKDAKLIRRLKLFDAVIISECTPNGFLRRLYNVQKFKEIIKKPVGFYEVYYLGNAPTQIAILEKNDDAVLSRFDFHLSVADVTETKQPPNDKWFPIGIRGESWNLKPLPKKKIIAIIDFVHPGNEEIRAQQIFALNKAGIKYISLEKPLSIPEIRNIYQQGAIYFMQSFEAFGLPILECLSAGAQIFTKESWWPMSWRLNDNPKVHGEGTLPDCFTIYNDEETLLQRLKTLKDNYDVVESPKKVFDIFLENYPQFYHGNENEMLRFIKRLDKIKNG